MTEVSVLISVLEGYNCSVSSMSISERLRCSVLEDQGPLRFHAVHNSPTGDDGWLHMYCTALYSFVDIPRQPCFED